MALTGNDVMAIAANALEKHGEPDSGIAYYIIDDVEAHVVRHACLAPFMHAYVTIDLLDNGDTIVWFKRNGYNLRKQAEQLALDMQRDIDFWEGVYGKEYWVH